MYYNPETNEFLEKKDLCLKYNSSIPSTIKEFKGWYKVHYEDRPVANEFQKVQENKIQLIDGVYKITYSVIDYGLEVVRTFKGQNLEQSFDEIYNSKHLKLQSSLGFEINANNVANTNIDGLIKVLRKTGQEGVLFRDYNNELHKVTLDDLETMQMEIIMNAQTLYAKKWELENAINNATTMEELLSIEDNFFLAI